MPPKEKTESTALQVFNLDNLNPALLPELATFKEIQLKVVKENPFVAIVDTASRDLAKKHRTARKTARTDLEKQDKLISSKFNEAKTKSKTYIAELIDITKPGEEEQQKEIDRDEAEAELKRQEKARLEQVRIDNIKKELDDYVAEWKTAINIMSFESIEKVSADFLESYTTFDTTILQEFESLFPTKVEELTKILSDKTVLLTEAENARLEKERTNLELKRTKELIAAGFSFDGNNYFVSDFKRLDMGTILDLYDSDFNGIIEAGKIELARLAKIESDLLIKKEEEKEAIYEIRKKRLEEAGMIYSDEHDTLWIEEDADYILLAEDVSNWGALEFEETFSEVKTIIQTAKDVVYDLPKTIPAEKVEVAEILVPENTTVNVCSPLEEREIHIAYTDNADNKTLLETPSTPKESFVAPTWDSIIKDFQDSGEKSYSKWLKNNYNVPTKIQ